MPLDAGPGDDTAGGATPEQPTATAPEQADVEQRLGAALIDVVITLIVSVIPILGGLLACAYWLLRDGLDINGLNQRSLGKAALGLRPATLDGQHLDITTSIRRNCMLGGASMASTIAPIAFFLPVIGMLFFGLVLFAALMVFAVELVTMLVDVEHRRLGDKLAGTRVIRVDA